MQYTEFGNYLLVALYHCAELNTWMEELDKHYKKKLEWKSSTTPSKPRVYGSPATSLPHINAPQWAVDPDWIGPNPLSGMLMDSFLRNYHHH